MKKLLAALVSVAAIAIAAPSAATVVTFDSLGFQSNYVMSTGGLTFTNPGGAVQYFINSYSGGAYDPNGFYMYSYGTITVAKTDGSAFQLNSIDLGSWFSGGATFRYLLNLAGGGTQAGTVNLTSSFVTTTFGQSITSMVMYDPGTYVAFNNLTYDAPAAAVPEPAMLGLFGFGAIGLGLSRRRKA